MNNSDLEILIKFIDQYPLKTKKFLDYEDLKLLRQLKKEKVHLTEKGLEQMKKNKRRNEFWAKNRVNYLNYGESH